jgi:hypothetical protein
MGNRARRRRYKRETQRLVARAEELLTGSASQHRVELLKKRIAANFQAALEKYTRRGIPLPVAVDVVKDLVEDPIVRGILEQREAR